MTIDWNDILKLPEGALAGEKRIPKTQLAEQAKLAKAAKNPGPLLDKLREVRFFASLTKSNSCILPMKDDTYDIESVIFLACGLNSSKGFSETLRMVHGCFPNPTVILATGYADSGIAVSVATRRKNQVEHGAFVTERIQTSGLFDPEKEAYRPYLERLAFPALPQTTLLAYLRALGDRSQLAYAVRSLGYYPLCKDDDAGTLMGHVKELDSLSSKINELNERRRAKDASLGETTKLRVEMRKLEQQRDAVKVEIKELCE